MRVLEYYHTKKDKKTKHRITIITITKKLNLINYNNAPLTNTTLLKKKEKEIIKFENSIEKKNLEKLNTRGKRPEASTLKEYMEFP